jgi:nucleoside-diphosphate-sugar epimerase
MPMKLVSPPLTRKAHVTTDNSGRRVAIIGGAGFIGHNLALHLSAQGAEVEVIDSLQVNNMGAIASGGYPRPQRDLYLRMINERLDLLAESGVRLVPQDARDYHTLSRALDDFRPDVIVMAAAVSHAGRSNKDPYSTFDHSLRTLENALDCARGRRLQFVYLSSSMVYGDFLTPEVTEDHPLNSIGIYGALKVAGEKIVTAYQQVFDLPYTIIRPSALYGARCVSRRVGQVFIENAIAGQPLRIEGDGSDRVDFTYVDDLVRGISLAIAHPAALNQTFNMTYGSARSVGEIADIVCRHFPEATIERVERDRLMPFRGTLNVDKARDLLGYDPQFPVERGFPAYIDWYRELHGLPQLPVAA